MYRKLLISDIHLQVLDPLGIPGDYGISTRTYYKIEQLFKMVDYAIANKVNEVVDLGDTFTFLNPPDKLRILYAEVVKKAIDAGIAWTRILGNHETDGQFGVGLDTALLSRDLYRVISGIDFDYFCNQIMYIPELSQDEIQKALEDHPDHLVIGHFGVAGAMYSNGMEEKDGIPATMFVNREYPTFLGHIHKRQFVCGKQVFYIGAMFKHNFGDSNIKTGWLMLDIDPKTDIILKESPFIGIDDIGLHKFVIEEGCTVPELTVTEGDVVKLSFVGSSSWFSGYDVPNLVRTMKAAGVSKVDVVFESSGQVDAEATDFSEGFNYRDVVEKQAVEDKVDAAFGLKYLNTVLKG